MTKNCLQCNKTHNNKKFCCNSCKTTFNWKDIKYRNRQINAHKGYIPTNLSQLAEHARSEKHRKWLSLQKKGKTPWNKGIKMPEISGENSPHWIKDRSKLAKKQERNDSSYREWRKKVWLRDNFTCKIANPNCNGRIEAHHILGWTEYPELRYQLNNGITLCHAHHPRRRAEEKRLSPYFMELVSVSSK